MSAPPPVPQLIAPSSIITWGQGQPFSEIAPKLPAPSSGKGVAIILLGTDAKLIDLDLNVENLSFIGVGSVPAILGVNNSPQITGAGIFLKNVSLLNGNIGGRITLNNNFFVDMEGGELGPNLSSPHGSILRLNSPFTLTLRLRHGAKIRGKLAGAFGDVSAVSMAPGTVANLSLFSQSSMGENCFDTDLG